MLLGPRVGPTVGFCPPNPVIALTWSLRRMIRYKRVDLAVDMWVNTVKVSNNK
jgi:hypothetical protein